MVVCESSTIASSISVNKMRVAGLFSGIGGFELAFSDVGFETDLLVEVDPAARAVLAKQFPDVAIEKDVSDLTGLPESADVLTAGFPCQNLSMAGDKSGIGGPKSGIVEKMFELIGRSRVQTVIIENVYFMLQLDRGTGMRWLVEKFEELNYKWAYRVLDTMGFGLPQRRRRVYFIASRTLDPRQVLFSDDWKSPGPYKIELSRPIGFYWTEGRSGIGLTVDGIPPLKVGSTLGIPSPPAVLFPDGEVLMPSLTACEALQGFPPGWTAVPQEGSSKNPAWRLIGNAVSIPVARWIAQRLKLPGDVLEFPMVEIAIGRTWPDAAWNVGDGRIGVIAGDKPITNNQPSISLFRDATWNRLSDRALNGFIGRAIEGGLWVPDGFLDTLRNAERRDVRAA
jgi:DNA (cytosine-5)-methyltransferase 1